MKSDYNTGVYRLRLPEEPQYFIWTIANNFFIGSTV